MKARLSVCLTVLLLSLSFCFFAYAEFKNETKIKHNEFSIAKISSGEVDIDWVDTLSIQWCEYPFAD